MKMKLKTKQALTVACAWSMLFSFLFYFNMLQFTIASALVFTVIIIPVQFIMGFCIARVIAWSNRGGMAQAMSRFFSWCISVGNRIHTNLPGVFIQCQDGGDDCTHEAEWACYCTKWWRREYPTSPIEYYCTSCMIDNMNGLHTGGGPTSESYDKFVPLRKFRKIQRIKAPEFNKLDEEDRIKQKADALEKQQQEEINDE